MVATGGRGSQRPRVAAHPCSTWRFRPPTDDEIEKNIKQIERIEGNEGLQGRFAQVRFLIWQAAQGSDKKKQEELRTAARELLNELRSRRADCRSFPWPWPSSEEQELRQELKQGGLTEE